MGRNDDRLRQLDPDKTTLVGPSLSRVGPSLSRSRSRESESDPTQVVVMYRGSERWDSMPMQAYFLLHQQRTDRVTRNGRSEAAFRRSRRTPPCGGVSRVLMSRNSRSETRCDVHGLPQATPLVALQPEQRSLQPPHRTPLESLQSESLRSKSLQSESLQSGREGGFVLMQAGRLRVLSLALRVRDCQAPVVITIVGRGDDAGV